MAPNSRSPWLTRFLSDFTLGFADGLTVPFALSAGLSSLGRTDTVIDAGLAELCAGSISMGIGGYLSAKDELAAREGDKSSFAMSGEDGNERGEEMKGMLRGGSYDGRFDEKDGEAQEEFVRLYLEPLSLPLDVTDDILSQLKGSRKGLHGVTRNIMSQRDAFSSEPSMGITPPISPLASGIYISIGYVVGGLIPLLPYIFTANVGRGLIWSTVVCLISLFIFGAGKTWLLRGGGFASNMRQCLWEGAQMLVFGSLAAGVSALCVTLLGSSDAPVG